MSPGVINSIQEYANMKLRHDPFQVFRVSKTPAGIYARQKWLGEADTPEWQRDFQWNTFLCIHALKNKGIL